MLFTEISAFIQQNRRDEARLEDLARQLAQHQYACIPLYRRLCEKRGVQPGSATLDEIPAVSVGLFKRAEMHCAPDTVVRRFMTSGTTSGGAQKGTSCFSEADLALMDEAIDVNARVHLFPDTAARRTRILVLAPPPDAAPAMIMVYGMARLVRQFGLDGSGFLMGAAGLDLAGLLAHCRDAVEKSVPLTIIGASFGFVRLFDVFAEQGISFRLPEGSRVMDAGGFKARSREVTRADMLEAFERLLGIAPSHCVNLLGMTEHASQFYDDSLAAAHSGRKPLRGKQNPPWTRTWAVDPETLAVLPHGQPGLLRHLDLANGGHPAFVQTDDFGVTSEEGFEVLGSGRKAEDRGCSITVDELLNREQVS